MDEPADRVTVWSGRYLLEEPTYVKFHTTPLPPPEPSAKKGKKGKGGGGKKGKKEKVVPPPAFQMGLDEALARLYRATVRTGDRGPSCLVAAACLPSDWARRERTAGGMPGLVAAGLQLGGGARARGT